VHAKGGGAYGANPELWTGESYDVAGEIIRSAYQPHAEALNGG
jgi:hypothetical protein